MVSLKQLIDSMSIQVFHARKIKKKRLLKGRFHQTGEHRSQKRNDKSKRFI